MFEKQESPQVNGGLMKAAKIANAKQAERNNENETSGMNGSKPASSAHERKASITNTSSLSKSTVAKSPTLAQPAGGPTPSPHGGNQNPWQQATGRKGHKKGKSSSGASPRGPQGQSLPVNESERKGG